MPTPLPLPCYLNGEYTVLPDAKTSVMDRGFIFGDGVYKVMPLYARQPFRFAQYIARLVRSLAELRLTNPLTDARWLGVASNLIARCAHSTRASAEFTDQLVYIQITRGVACATADDSRWQKANIKSTSLLGAVFARQISVDAGAVETVMFRDGYLNEAAASNVWVVKNGTVLGPPPDNRVLEGTRYSLSETLCKANGLPFELRRIHRDAVLAADELLLSSATKELLPVTPLDDQPVGDGLSGPVYRTLYAGYQNAKKEQRHL